MKNLNTIIADTTCNVRIYADSDNAASIQEVAASMAKRGGIEEYVRSATPRFVELTDEERTTVVRAVCENIGAIYAS